MDRTNVLAIIPARGGSKGVPGKNIKNLNGKPLIHYAIETAQGSCYINKIIVSTDDLDIAKVSKAIGAEIIMRPSEMAEDKSLVIDAIRYTIQECEIYHTFSPDIIVLLECTSPIKSITEIDDAIEKLINNDADSVASFKETAVSPNRLWKIVEDKVEPFIENASPFQPRQVQPKGYELTGQFYAFTYKILKDNPEAISILLGRVAPIVTKLKPIDIDEEVDFLFAEAILKFYDEKNINNRS